MMVNNRAPFDEWSIIHASWGILFEKYGIGLGYALLLHTLFEFAENSEPIRGWLHRLGREPREGDSGLNIVGDTASMLAGYALSRGVN